MNKLLTMNANDQQAREMLEHQLQKHIGRLAFLESEIEEVNLNGQIEATVQKYGVGCIYSYFVYNMFSIFFSLETFLFIPFHKVFFFEDNQRTHCGIRKENTPSVRTRATSIND